jgi:hypothetical protein
MVSLLILRVGISYIFTVLEEWQGRVGVVFGGGFLVTGAFPDHSHGLGQQTNPGIVCPPIPPCSWLCGVDGRFACAWLNAGFPIAGVTG